ncbi:hypothetical protein [Alloactinosynnema sp. L-07]|uniref:hypothetical protein n=1 Tax=Alloactinosynnema sp. L-07 TaxID=1653480 RepID=UPI00065EF8C1|nr:hypothetical protein [Alloactinosynnema sp. L-07]CRK59527.1 hypothetical protein [Alloactinosynnema sp. L-07]
MAPHPRIQMDIETIERVGAHLTTIGRALGIDWTAFRQRIATGESGIGTGVLGARYRVEYTPPADAIRRVADPLPGRFGDLGRAATLSAQSYSAGDKIAADQFPR